VGDNPEDDVKGANNMGIDAVLINRPGRKPQRAPLMIDTLWELEPIIFEEIAVEEIRGGERSYPRTLREPALS
jgi:hypothetical protein